MYAEITVEPQPACEFNPLEGPEMVLIESGVFSMGSPADEENRASDEGPVHQVAVQAFSLSRCEVTVQEFETFVSETGYITDAEQFDLEGQVKGCFGFAETNAENWRNPGFSQTSQSAVVCVSFRDTQAYSLWLSLRTGQSYRLPSEAEWEYAARGTKATAYPWGKEASHEYANYSGVGARDQWQYTSPVGSFSANDFGLYDMHGNAWEWAEDCWQGDYNGAPVDGSPWLEEDDGGCGTHVLRGGAWSLTARFLRSASRLRHFSDGTLINSGFRVARTLEKNTNADVAAD